MTEVISRNFSTFFLFCVLLSDVLCADLNQRNPWGQLSNNQNGPADSKSSASWPELGVKPTRGGPMNANTNNLRPNSYQDPFILHEQNNGQSFGKTPNNQQTRVNSRPVNMGPASSNSNRPLTRQDTFIVKPKDTNTKMGLGGLNRQDTFIVPPKNPSLNRQDTFVVNPQSTNAWNKGNPLGPPAPTKPTGQMASMGPTQSTNAWNKVNPSGPPTPTKPTGQMTSMGPMQGTQNTMGGTTNAWNRGNPFGSGPTPTKPTDQITSNRPSGMMPRPSSPTLNTRGGTGSNLYVPPAGNVNEDDELRDFSENLLRKDVNNLAKYVTVNFQRMTTSRSQNDEAPLPLMMINQTVYSIPSISKLMALYNNYILKTNTNEVYTAQEKMEENELLDSLLQTPVMQYTRNFLIHKGKLGRDPREFQNLLKQIWFNMYSRGNGKIGSSGFEHVFLGEIKNSDVSGLHNWLYFDAEERKKEANYLGYLKKIDLGGKGAILKHHFTFHGLDKPVGSMFIGTSPELEMAFYSTCFILRADRVCPLKLNNNRFIIRTFTFRYRGKNMIGSAFPEI